MKTYAIWAIVALAVLLPMLGLSGWFDWAHAQEWAALMVGGFALSGVAFSLYILHQMRWH